MMRGAPFEAVTASPIALVSPTAPNSKSLLALTAVPASSRRKFKGRQFDEREKEIASKALLAGFRAVWLVCIAYVLWMGLANGWETGVTMPAWMFSEFLWLLAMLLLAVEALTTLVLYRRGNHV